jgi:hypothetical protein
MYTVEENQIINIADGFTIIYAFLGRNIIEALGEDGEKALREGTRRYGRDRARTLREKHLKKNVKINMHSLFAVGPDLPPDPRFERELQRLLPEERVSHTLFCPMADLWKKYGAMDIGRIYCEEFHNACYGEYGYGYTQVNLARTQTQQRDEYCAFNVILRAAKLPEELRSVCFEEYDPKYEPPKELPEGASGKSGFNILWIKLYYHILSATEELLGEKGVNAVIKALEEIGYDAAKRLKNSAKEQNLELNREFIDLNYPLALSADEEPLWSTYNGHNAKKLLEEHFYPIFKREVGI